MPYTPSDFGIGVLFNNVFDAVIVGDARTGSVVLWNGGATTLFGYDEAEALGRPLEHLVPPSYRERHRSGVRAFVEGGRSALVDRGWVEVHALHRYGEEFAVRLRLMRVDGPDDGVYVAAIISREGQPVRQPPRRTRRWRRR